jgi:hypothetical protein
MKTYRWLRRWMGPAPAWTITVVWLVLLVMLAIYFGVTAPDAEFRYLEL